MTTRERADALEDAARLLERCDPRDTITLKTARWLLVFAKRIRSLKGAPEAGRSRPSPSPQQHEEGK